MARFRFAPLFLMLLAACGSTCKKNAEDNGTALTADNKIELPGVDTKSLTSREHGVWSGYMKELLAPCPNVAVPLAQCVQEKRDCNSCKPAAQFVLRLVQAGRPKKEVVGLFEARFSPNQVKTIVIGGSPAKGPEDAPVTLVEFADFECPACGMAYPLVEEMFRKFDGKLRVVFKHFPLDSHPNARPAAQASFAAQKQGRFWAMHKHLFTHQDRLTEPDLMQYAADIKIDVARFKTDMNSDAAKARVDQERGQGEGLGVSFTPTIYINGRNCDLSRLPDPLTDLEAWIALEIAMASGAKGDSPAPAPSGSAAAAPSSSSAAAAPSASAAVSATASAAPAPPKK